jgi:hypothetical protein
MVAAWLRVSCGGGSGDVLARHRRAAASLVEVSCLPFVNRRFSPHDRTSVFDVDLEPDVDPRAARSSSWWSTIPAKVDGDRSTGSPRSTQEEQTTMRFMMLVKASADSEAGVLPDEELLAEMGRFNEELVKAGVLLAGEGLHPTSKGVRVRYCGRERTVVDGPFSETKELIAGFWLLQVKSLEEAVEWARRVPFEEGEVEIRQVFESDDFGDAMTPELRENEERLRRQLEAKSEDGPDGQT